MNRQQALDCGVTTAHIRSQVHRRRWVAVHRGVYVAHTGPLTWTQRAWCAVLDTAPSALSHESALHAGAGGGSDRGPIHVSVDAHRNVRRRPGVVVHYRADLAAEFGLIVELDGRLTLVLNREGWAGRPHPCDAPDCVVGQERAA
ncbi:hypothetical protein L5G28_03510 [Gordonia sp. HY285]|uniref:hypothetical protein n=1 Tax=Gordonia liuliyuniae TaxID=2911517 RepID=UPI001F45B0E3|nr:hypothetical protein [Gordonia liuliyuniae]MCF8609232.1 hypothetical protein [Gordonia liuliyuniae]